jgi:hypothetical protein
VFCDYGVVIFFVGLLEVLCFRFQVLEYSLAVLQVEVAPFCFYEGCNLFFFVKNNVFFVRKFYLAFV